MKKVILGISVLILIGAAIFAWSHYSQKNKAVQAEKLFWQGRKAASTNNDLEALKLLTAAVQSSPENAEFNFWAGVSASKMGKKDLAYSFLKKSWDLGKKEPEVFISMNATSSLPSKERSIYFESMVNDLAEEQVRLELGALLKYQREDLEGAAKLLKLLTTKYPEGTYAEFYTQVLIRLKEPEAALKVLENTRAADKMNPACYTMLSELYIAIDDLKSARELYEEAISKGMNTPGVTFGYGSSLFFYGGSDIAKEILTQIELPELFSSTSITSPEIFKEELKKDAALAKLLIESSSPALKSALKEENSDRFSNQKFLSLAVVALNNFCKRSDWFTTDLLSKTALRKDLEELSQKKKLNAQENFMLNARVLAATFTDSLQVPEFNFITHNARIILMAITSTDDDTKDFDNLIKLSKGSRRWLEGERYFGSYLLEVKNGRGDSTLAKDSFDAAVLLLSDNDTVQVNLADTLARQGNFQDALVILDKVSSNNLILARSPLIQQIRSGVMIASGDLKGGQKVLISLMRRGYITEELLVELSQVSLALGDSATSNTTIKQLKEYAAKKPSLRLLVAQLLLNSKDITAAISELDTLLHDNITPELNTEATLLKARAEIMADRAKAAIKTLLLLKDDTTNSQVIKAQALNKLGKKSESLAILEKLTPLPESSLSLYATLLANAGRLAEAKTQLDRILSIEPNNVDALLNLGLILSLLGDSNEAITKIERALDISPDNIRGNTLLAQILLSTGKPKKAANLALMVLNTSPEYQVALDILPSAYNASKEFPKAILSSDRSLKNAPNNPFIIMQKAIGLVGLSNELERERATAKSSANKEHASNTDKNEEELLNDEIASLTDDIVYTGAISELGSSSVATKNSIISEFANGRSSRELKKEAIKLLDTIIDQSAALVYKLEIELMLGESKKVIEEIQSGKLEANELFSLGVISDRRKEWDVARAAYKEAHELQSNNPIILNNYANSIILSEKEIDVETKAILIEAANNLPKTLNGDIKAVSTSAMIYDYLNDWDNILVLAEEYPEQFKEDPKLKNFLQTARERQPSTQKVTQDTNKNVSNNK